MEKSPARPSAAFLRELQNRSGQPLVYGTDPAGNVFACFGWSGDAAEVAAVEASQNSSVEQTVGHLEAAILQKMWAQLEGVTGYGKRDKADVVSELAVVIQEQRTLRAQVEARFRYCCKVVRLTVSSCRHCSRARPLWRRR